MNATPPEAKTEYSRGPASSGGISRSRPARSRQSRPRGALRGPADVLLAGGLLGAGLLLVAEFTTLFVVHGGSGHVLETVGAGANHGYALVPIALLTGLLAFAIRAAGSRPALLAIGVLGVIALLIALLGDLPDAHASGLVVASGGRYQNAASTPSAGLYLETLGAIVLLITCVCGFLLIGPPAGNRRSPQTTDGRVSAS